MLPLCVERLGHAPSVPHIYRALLLMAEDAVERGAVDDWLEFEREDLQGDLVDRRCALAYMATRTNPRMPAWLAEFARS